MNRHRILILSKKSVQSVLTSLFLLMFVFGSSAYSWANSNPEIKNDTGLSPVQMTVSGTVTDSAGEPLPGANVIVQGTTNGTQTDFDGNYSINAASDAVLVVSYLGFQTQEVSVNGRSSIDVMLAEDASALEEVIVTGYQTFTKKESTAAVSVVQADELAGIPSGNIEQQLQGRVPGVTVITNGQPGTTSQVRVRGFNAFGGNSPLYIVDGVPTQDISFINPDDIATATVLKDAASASIYGARAANGVIVYTTKSGSKTKRETSISLNVSTGFTDPNVNGSIEMLNPTDMARYTHIAYENNAAANGTPVAYTHPQYGSAATPVLPDYLFATGVGSANISQAQVDANFAAIQAAYEADPGNTFLIRSNKAGTNWYDEITRQAPVRRVTLGFDGGNENSRFYIGLSGQDQSGIVLGQEFQRFALRVNSEFDVTPWLTIGENFQTTYRSAVGIFGGGGGVEVADDESEVLSAYRMPTIIPVFDEFGSYASTKAAGYNNPRNPVRRLVQNQGSDKNYSIGGFGNIYATIKPIEGLTLRTSLGGQFSNYHYVNYDFKYFGDSEPQASDNFGEGSGYSYAWTFTNTAEYQRDFGKHGIRVLGGIEALNTGAGRNINGSGINPFSTDLDFQSLSVVQSPVVNSNLFKGVNFFSVFGKLDYNYDDTYLVTGILRRDGSSRFGANSRYGVFPAVSGAWRISNEDFMSNNDNINELVVRAGWGEMGNSENVDPNNQYSLYNANRGRTFYPIGGQNSGADEGFAASRIGNPDAKWETSTTVNIGFDLGLWNDKLRLELDWWDKTTDDLLYTVPLAAVTGNYAAAPSVNIASMANTGLDFAISTRGEIGDKMQFNLVLNNAFLNNEITALAPGIEFFDTGNYRGITPVRNAVGQSISSFFGYDVIGYFNSQAEVDSAPAQVGAGIGRFRYADVNGDGAITPDDRTFIGSPVPDYTGGLTFDLYAGNFEMTMMWYWSIGNDIFNQRKWFTDFFGSFEGSAKGAAAFNSWTPELGNNAAAPIWESASNLSTNGASNSWYVEDGSFARLQMLSLAYNFDRDKIEQFGLSKLKLGVSANNIWTITGYEGLDPMVAGPDTNFGIDVGNFPVTPSYLFNLELGILGL